MGNFFFIESHSFIKLRFLIFKLAGGERFVKNVCGGRDPQEGTLIGGKGGAYSTGRRDTTFGLVVFSC